MGVFLALIGV